MKPAQCIGLALLLTVVFTQDAATQTCKSVQLDALGNVDICMGDKGLTASPITGTARLISCPPAWELELRPAMTFSRVRMRVHSAGPYYVKDRLIMKVCALEPAFVKSGEMEWNIERGRCSQWIDLGTMNYRGPRDCYGAAEPSEN